MLTKSVFVFAGCGLHCSADGASLRMVTFCPRICDGRPSFHLAPKTTDEPRNLTMDTNDDLDLSWTESLTFRRRGERTTDRTSNTIHKEDEPGRRKEQKREAK